MPRPPRPHSERYYFLIGERSRLLDMSRNSILLFVATTLLSYGFAGDLSAARHAVSSMPREAFLALAMACAATSQLDRHQPSHEHYRHLPVPRLNDFLDCDCRSMFRFRKEHIWDMLRCFGLLDAEGSPKKLYIRSSAQYRWRNKYWRVYADTKAPPEMA